MTNTIDPIAKYVEKLPTTYIISKPVAWGDQSIETTSKISWHCADLATNFTEIKNNTWTF